MSNEVLGSSTFLVTPTVNGSDVLLNAGGVPVILADTTANRPSAGTLGRLFLDTTTNVFYRDNGSSWDSIGSSSTLTGTANQIDITGGVVSIASNPIIPGTTAMRLPVGTTAQRSVAPSAGDMRYNSTLGYAEKYTGAYWGPLGLTLQVVTGAIPAATTTSTIPYDNTTPLSTEGAQLWSQSFTPLSATSRIIVMFTATLASSTTTGTNSVITATFAGTTNIGSTINTVSAVNEGLCMANTIVYSPGSTATITFSARFGGQSGTSYCNTTTTGTLGGSLVTQYIIMEIE